MRLWFKMVGVGLFMTLVIVFGVWVWICCFRLLGFDLRVVLWAVFAFVYVLFAGWVGIVYELVWFRFAVDSCGFVAVCCLGYVWFVL